MNADLQGALNQIDKLYRTFVHNGKTMSKDEVRKVLEYGISKGYTTTAELSQDEIDSILNEQP